MTSGPTPNPTTPATGASERRVNPTSARGLAALLAALAMLGPFSIDSYLPAFPDIEQSLGVTQIQVQQTLTAYLVSFAVMILWHGALSDAFGRRNVILCSLGVFAVASLGCAAAHTVAYLWAFRILQGVTAGAGVVVGRAMIRDAYHGHEAERLLALVTMIFAIGPAIAPVLGGWIVGVLDWRSIFLFLFVYAALLAWLCWHRLPETLPPARRVELRAHLLVANYRRVFTTPRFHFYSATISFNFAGLFLYVAAAPTFLIEHLHLTAQQFAWQFIPSVAGIFAGALAVNRLAGRVRINVQVRVGFMLLAFAAVSNLSYHLMFAARVPWSVLPLFFYCFGMSLAAPGITLLVLDLYPDIRGVLASCQSFTQTMLASVVAAIIAPALSVSVVALAAGQFTFIVLGFIAWRLGKRIGASPRH